MGIYYVDSESNILGLICCFKMFKLQMVSEPSQNKHQSSFSEGFVSYKHASFLFKPLIDGLEWCRLLVDYCDVFISCLDSHSDGTHSLHSIHL